MNKTIFVLLLIIVLCIATAASMKMYLVSNDSGGTVFWKPGEAYIVATGSRQFLSIMRPLGMIRAV
jgi:hypothetical protein